MRTSVVLWSTASGAILGLFLDALLVGVAILASVLMPTLSGRLSHRGAALIAVVLLLALPVTMAVLGFLEGRLKAG